jgi:hypothetical protein
MNFIELQESLEDLSLNINEDTFIFDLLGIYDFPKSTIKKLKLSPSKNSGLENVLILKNKFLFHMLEEKEDLHLVIDQYQKQPNKFSPRFIIVTNFNTFLAFDTKTSETLDIGIQHISKHYAFFLPWVGMEKTQHENENPADIKASLKMAKLYDQIVADNSEYSKNKKHDLNIFLSRLLFCYFAEDTQIFTEDPNGIFINNIDSHTSTDGQDLDTYLHDLFLILNTPDSERNNIPHHFTQFPYVNGGLFDIKIELPIFSSKSRKMIIDCGKQDWSRINPDIFGSMIQAVVHPDHRENLGMHYTSVPNIMKVLQPLFLDELYEELQKAGDSISRLEKLRERIVDIKIFDPACGSGNFLIIAYKRLCELESVIIKRVLEKGGSKKSPAISAISLNSFYGIEIDDFAHEIARLSLWIAQYQVNEDFGGLFGLMKPILPLKESGHIVCENATRIDWNDVCPSFNIKTKKENEVYVVGNPPYLGSRNQKKDQKDDMKNLFIKDYKSLDYISAWFYKGALYINGSDNIQLAFVSTNSITQGEQVALLWPRIFDKKISIHFAHQSFKWSNLAKGNAGVTCVIIGLTVVGSHSERKIYNERRNFSVKKINPYLTEGDFSIISRRSSPLTKYLPKMVYGNLLNDGGNLVLSTSEKNDLVSNNPKLSDIIKNYIGSREFIRGLNRYCLYIQEEDLDYVNSIPEINKRLENIRVLRSNSTEKSTRLLSKFPHKFYFHAHRETPSILVPRTSSEFRDYVPMGFFDSYTIISDAAQVVYDARPFIFSMLNSKMHMVWIKSVCGRLKTDIRYSSALGYNTFPFPKITEQQEEMLTGHVYNILEERERHPDKTMAELYDPEKMPDGLREAHKYNDLAIESLYRKKLFENDEERLAHLFELYEKMITNENNN